MLWFNCHLLRSSSATTYRLTVAQALLSARILPLVTTSQDSRQLRTHWRSLQSYHSRLGTMAPKQQATLGYVKSGQQTLGCAFMRPEPHNIFIYRLLIYVKIFLREAKWCETGSTTAVETQALFQGGDAAEERREWAGRQSCRSQW